MMSKNREFRVCSGSPVPVLDDRDCSATGNSGCDWDQDSRDPERVDPICRGDLSGRIEENYQRGVLLAGVYKIPASFVANHSC